MFSAVFHLSPADVDDLSPREALVYLEQLPRFMPAPAPEQEGDEWQAVLDRS